MRIAEEEKPNLFQKSGTSRSSNKSVNNNKSNNASSSSTSTNTKTKKECCCAPTTHPGSFKCRYHRSFTSGPSRDRKVTSPKQGAEGKIGLSRFGRSASAAAIVNENRSESH